MNDYLSLLLKYQALPRISRSVTFMEIAGYPHYENVCSNILAFYLDPKGEHGLGTLLLKAFVAMVPASGIEVAEMEAATVIREHPMGEGKRIDLVVDAEQFTLGIENKIFHWEANDLELYSHAIDALGTGKSVIKALLCLNTSPTQMPAPGGFLRYTYRSLWQRVRDFIGHHAASADPKWVAYLYDFMKTTSRLAGETLNEREVADFFVEHEDVIERLVADRDRLFNQVAQVIRSIRDNLSALPETTKYLKSRWIYQNFCLASHFDIQGATVGLDLNGNLQGWTLTLFQMNGPTHVMTQLAASSPITALSSKPAKPDKSVVLQSWDRHATEPEILEAMVRCFQALIEAGDLLTGATPAKP